MRVIAVTHASAEQRAKNPGLTKAGISEAVHVAEKILELYGKIAPVAVLTSPKERCKDTVSLICENLGLTAKPFKPQKVDALGRWELTSNILAETLRKFASPKGNDTILVCLHASLANALRIPDPLSPASVETPSEPLFFKHRPILAVLDYSESGTYLRECLELQNKRWKDLVVAKRGKNGTVAIGTWPTPE